MTTRRWLFLELEVFRDTLFARLLKDTVGLFTQFPPLPIAGKPAQLITGRSGVQQQRSRSRCQGRQSSQGCIMISFFRVIIGLLCYILTNLRCLEVSVLRLWKGLLKSLGMIDCSILHPPTHPPKA